MLGTNLTVFLVSATDDVVKVEVWDVVDKGKVHFLLNVWIDSKRSLPSPHRHLICVSSGPLPLDWLFPWVHVLCSPVVQSTVYVQRHVTGTSYIYSRIWEI